jgi:hypothetical protein
MTHAPSKAPDGPTVGQEFGDTGQPRPDSVDKSTRLRGGPRPRQGRRRTRPTDLGPHAPRSGRSRSRHQNRRVPLERTVSARCGARQSRVVQVPDRAEVRRPVIAVTLSDLAGGSGWHTGSGGPGHRASPVRRIVAGRVPASAGRPEGSPPPTAAAASSCLPQRMQKRPRRRVLVQYEQDIAIPFPGRCRLPDGGRSPHSRHRRAIAPGFAAVTSASLGPCVAAIDGRHRRLTHQPSQLPHASAGHRHPAERDGACALRTEHGGSLERPVTRVLQTVRGRGPDHGRSTPLLEVPLADPTNLS